MFGIKKLCKQLVFKYVFGFAMRLLICKLFKSKVVKGLFEHLYMSLCTYFYCLDGAYDFNSNFTLSAISVLYDILLCFYLCTILFLILPFRIFAFLFESFHVIWFTISSLLSTS